MTAFDDAVVTVLLGDYIGIDASGKFNVLGEGFQFTALQPTGTTAPQYVGVIVDLPPRYAGQTMTLSLELWDLTENTVFKLPGPTGSPEALRASQVVPLERPGGGFAPGFVMPASLPCRSQMVMGFGGGLPLTPGKDYEWRVLLDSKRRKGWVARFSVLEPVPPPVVGGLAGPADIPNVGPVSNEYNDDEAPES